MARNIPVFRAEQALGLEDRIRSSTSLAYLSQIEPLLADGNLAKHILAYASHHTEGETLSSQPDLFYMKDLLVSTGWNRNDDVFDRMEVWQARNTSVDKPLNFEHNPIDICGHITSSIVVNDDMEEIADDSVFDDLPDKFHIINGSVIYRVFSKDSSPDQIKDRSKLIDTTIAEIKNGEWFVSMECLLSHFDYALIAPDGTEKIIARDATSSCLTQYLRIYDGPGVVIDKSTGDEYKIGRVMRDYVFSGKGLVRKPGNKDSVIFANINTFKGVATDMGYITPGDGPLRVQSPEEEGCMQPSVGTPLTTPPEITHDAVIQIGVASESPPISMESPKMNETEIKAMQDELAALKATNTSLASQIKSRDEAAVASLKTDLQTSKTQLETVTASVSEAVTRAEKAEAALKVANTQVEEYVAVINQGKVDAARASRIKTMVDKGAEQAKAEQLADKFAEFTDEKFVETVDIISANWKAPKPLTPTEILKTVAAAAPAEPTLTVQAETSDVKATERVQAAASYISGFLNVGRMNTAETK